MTACIFFAIIARPDSSQPRKNRPATPRRRFRPCPRTVSNAADPVWLKPYLSWHVTNRAILVDGFDGGDGQRHRCRRTHLIHRVGTRTHGRRLNPRHFDSLPQVVAQPYFPAALQFVGHGGILLHQDVIAARPANAALHSYLAFGIFRVVSAP